MSRVLAYTAPSRGQLYPAVAILEELRRRGHQIALRTLSSEVARMRALGFDATPVAAAVEATEIDDWMARTPPGAAIRASRTFAARAPHDAVDLEQAIDEVRPDALLVDVAAWGALSAAEAWGGPWAAYCAYPLPYPSRQAPPLGPGLPPARGRPGRWRDAVLRSSFHALFDRIALPALGPVRASRGLPPLAHGLEMLAAPPLLLHLSAEPFEYPRSDWPPNVVLTGPCEWEPPGELPRELADVEEPLVLVTTSTEFQDDGRLIDVALEALAGERCHLVATMPTTARPTGPVPPANATVLPFAPHGPILDRAACAITHGGMGATQKALSRGVPVCAVPFGRDQFDVARRVEVAGAGTRLPAVLLTPRRLRRKVREAVGCSAGAARLAESFAATGGAATAADAFERLD